MFRVPPLFPTILATVVTSSNLVPIAVASEWNSQNGIRGSEARSKDSLRYSGRYPMLLTQGGTNEQAASDLIPFLLDDSAEIREKAFNDLSQLGVGVAVPALTGALQNPDWQVRVISAYSLLRLGPEASSAVPVLINALQDENADVRFSAALALGKINSDQAVSPLINALKDPDENVRFAAAIALLQFGSKVQGDNLVTFIRFLQDGNPMPVYPNFSKADTLTPEAKLGIPMFAEALGTGNWFLREQAAYILTSLKIDSIPALTNVIWIGLEGKTLPDGNAAPSSGYVRSVFTQTFLKTNSELLQESLKVNKNTEIREQANKILDIIQGKKTDTSPSDEKQQFYDQQEKFIGKLCENLQSSEINSINLEYALATLKPILLQEYTEDSEDLEYGTTIDKNRVAAVNCLRLFGLDAIPIIIQSLSEAKAFPIFLQALADSEDRETQDFSRRVLDQIGSKIIPDFTTIESFLIKKLQLTKNSDDDILEASFVIRALGKTRSESSVPILLETLKSDNLRDTGVIALGDIGSQKATPYLIQLLKQKSTINTQEDGTVSSPAPSEEPRINVIESLGKIGTPDIVPILVPYLDDPNWYIRLAAADALKNIGSAVIPPLLTILNNRNQYPLALQGPLVLKNADRDRTAAYVLWLIEGTARPMFEPQNIIPRQCFNDLPTVSVEAHQLLYAGRCIYGDQEGTGDSGMGFFNAIKNLLNRRNK